MAEKNLEYYLGLPYTIEVMRDAGDEISGWFARVVELPGCMTQADNFEELGEMIEDAMRAWIEAMLETGRDIPEPQPAESYSGKFIVRLPRSLHRELVQTADREGVSLNMYVAAALGKAVGQVAPNKPKVEAEPEQLVAVNWSRISDQARRLLLANGFSSEVEAVNEQLFASWIDNYLDQTRAALEMADYQQALNYLRPLRAGLEKLCGQSPLVNTYCQAIALLETQILRTYQLHRGLNAVEEIRNQVLEEIRANVIKSGKRAPETDPDQEILSLYFGEGNYGSVPITGKLTEDGY